MILERAIGFLATFEHNRLQMATLSEDSLDGICPVQASIPTIVQTAGRLIHWRGTEVMQLHWIERSTEPNMEYDIELLEDAVATLEVEVGDVLEFSSVSDVTHTIWKFVVLEVA